jgi:hypothetical protein
LLGELETLADYLEKLSKTENLQNFSSRKFFIPFGIKKGNNS